jgi:hypothetical protein
VFPLFEGAAAFAEGKEFFDQLKVNIYVANVGVGPEVARSVLNNPSGPKNAGELFVGDPYRRVGFAVLEVDVVTRTVFLDEVVFQKEGFIFVGSGDVFDAFDLTYQDPGLDRLRAGKVGSYPFFQVFGFSDIDDGPLLVFHEVDPGISGKILDKAFEILVHSDLKIPPGERIGKGRACSPGNYGFSIAPKKPIL